MVRIWVRTTRPDGSSEGHEETLDEKEFEGATVLSIDPHQILLKNGRELNVYAGNDGELGYEEEIDNSDPELMRKNQEAKDARLKAYYAKHPEEDPGNLPLHVNCRCVVVRCEEDDRSLSTR